MDLDSRGGGNSGSQGSFRRLRNNPARAQLNIARGCALARVLRARCLRIREMLKKISPISSVAKLMMILMAMTTMMLVMLIQLTILMIILMMIIIRRPSWRRAGGSEVNNLIPYHLTFLLHRPYYCTTVLQHCRTTVKTVRP